MNLDKNKELKDGGIDLERMKKKDFILTLKIHGIIGILVLIFLVISLWNQYGFEYVITMKKVFWIFVMCFVFPIPLSLCIGIFIWEFKDIAKESTKTKRIFVLVVIAMILRAIYQIKLHK